MLNSLTNQQSTLYVLSGLAKVSPEVFLIRKVKEILKRESQILRGNSG